VCTSRTSSWLIPFSKVTKIEGVFSGTLSYIFNEFSDGKSEDGPSFSSIVSVARQKGFTVRFCSALPAPREICPERVGIFWELIQSLTCGLRAAGTESGG
jgi:hypothetical protein